MRITGGTHRSRALKAPPGAATRPTSDRVREALFGILTSAGRVAGARVVDLYSGTGALALEALSRGAERAVLVECGRPAVACIRANAAALELEGRVVLVTLAVDQAISHVVRAGPFDLLLADPPWALVDSGECARSLTEVVRAGVLADDAMVVLEHATRSTAPSIELLERSDSRRYGDTTLSFYKPAILADAFAKRTALPRTQ